jgi:hypothetical protein
MRHAPARKLAPDAAVGRIAAALAAARELDASLRIPAAFTAADPAVVRALPLWVFRAALLKSARAWWLWCEPRKGRARDAQGVLDLPAGRYMVETLDTRTHTWVSCESAAGAPLVMGLPFTGRPVLACIRRVSTSSQVPSE